MGGAVALGWGGHRGGIKGGGGRDRFTLTASQCHAQSSQLRRVVCYSQVPCTMSQEDDSAASSTGTASKGKSGPKASPVWTDCFIKTGPLKSGRTPHKCKFCTWSCDGRVGEAEKHIANVCTKVPQNFQLAAQSRLVKKTANLPIDTLLTRTSKRQRNDSGSQQTLTGSGSVDSFRVSSAQKQTWDMALLRWIVMSGLPFNAINSPFFVTWVHSLRPNYRVAGVVTSCLL